MVKYRAKLEILHYITSFCLTREFGDGRKFGGMYGFRPMGMGDGFKPQPGDLVALTSAPASEWYLSWYVEYMPKGDYFADDHLLESVETGELCRWHNVGMAVFDQGEVEGHPEWRWEDGQFEFRDRWFRACMKTRDAHLTLPCQPVFHDGGGVTLATRTRFDLGGRFRRKFPNWKKVRVRDMLGFYDDVTGGDPLKT